MKQKLNDLENKINHLGDEQKLFHKLQLENNEHTDSQLVAQTDIIKALPYSSRKNTSNFLWIREKCKKCCGLQLITMIGLVDRK